MPKAKPGEIQISVRMPEDLHRWVTGAAKADLRSVNTFVVTLLQREREAARERDRAERKAAR